MTLSIFVTKTLRTKTYTINYLIIFLNLYFESQADVLKQF